MRFLLGLLLCLCLGLWALLRPGPKFVKGDRITVTQCDRGYRRVSYPNQTHFVCTHYHVTQTTVK